MRAPCPDLGCAVLPVYLCLIASEVRVCVLEVALACVPVRAAGVRLAFEPLHPLVCGGRSVISRVADALDFLDALNADDVFGLAVDSYGV